MLCFRFHVHRALLATTSKFFRRLFANPLEEDPKEVFELKNVDSAALAVLIRFIYSGGFVLNAVNVQSVLETADYLQIDGAVKLCCDQLSEQVDSANCLSIREFAELRGFNGLLERATSYIDDHFEDLWQSVDFLNLTSECVVGLLKRETLAVSCEELIFSAASRWIRHDEANRKKFTQALMGCVRMDELDPKVSSSPQLNSLVFRCISLAFLLQFIGDHVWDACSENGCLPMVKKIFDYLQSAGSRLQKSSHRHRWRMVTETLLCVKEGSTECFIPETDIWMKMKPIGRNHKSGVVFGEKLAFASEDVGTIKVKF